MPTSLRKACATPDAVRDAKREENAVRVYSALNRIATAYVGQVRSLSYATLRATQDPPWATVACGAAGVAAALVHARSGVRAREEASRWLRAAGRDAGRPGALWSPEVTRDDPKSLYYSEDGIGFLRLLLHSSQDVRPSRASLAFFARCRDAIGGPVELLQGAAGYLTALVLLHRRAPDTRALECADALAKDMLARVGAWSHTGSPTFAHGQAGAFHALLLWSIETARALPAPLEEALEHFADEAAATPAPRHAMDLSWCNGAAGMALVWTKAYAATRERRYLRLARRDARRLSSGVRGASGDLCCGFAGRAYALLALHAVDPNPDWLTRATDLGERAAHAMVKSAGAWPNGLFKGFPGLVCLARDLDTARRGRHAHVGFPLVEGGYRA